MNVMEDEKDGSFLWCSSLLASFSLFCPIASKPASTIKQSNSKERNYLGTPLPETPTEVRRKRRLLEGLLEAEESMQNIHMLNDQFTNDHHGEVRVNMNDLDVS